MVARKWLPAVLALAIALSGCGSGSKNSSAPTQTPTPQAPVTIEYWHINTDAFGGPAVKELVKKFNDTHPGITVVEKFQQGSYAGLTQNLQAALAAKKPPAVAQISYNYVDYVANFFQAVPIEKAAGSELNQVTDRYNDAVLKLGTSNGKLWGLPYGLSTPVLFYNPDLFKAAGLDPEKPPKTWEEVLQYARQIKAKTGKFGVHPQVVDNWMTQAMIESAGGHMLSADGTQVAFNSPEAIKAITYWKSLFDEGLAPKGTDDSIFPGFTSGDVAMTVTTIGRRGIFEQQAKFPVKVAELPGFEGLPKHFPAGGNTLMLFSQNPAELKAGWEFLKFMTQPDSITTWVKATGYVSPLKGLENDPQYLGDLFKQYPNMKPAQDQLPNAVRWVNYPSQRGLQVEQILLDARNAALMGGADPAKALNDAASKANDLIKGK